MIVALLIQQAFVDAQILAEEGEDATASQLRQGLNLLNRRIRKINMDGWEIPLVSEETSTIADGASDIELPGWVKLYKVQYLLGDVKFEIVLQNYNEFLSTAIITQTSGIPVIGYQKRTPTGITLKIFFTSNEEYPLYLYGFKGLTEVTYDMELDGSIEGFLQDYLLYQLAYDLQVYYQMEPSLNLVKEIREYETKIQRLKPIRIDKVPHSMGDTSGASLAAINLGGGWRP